MEEVLGIESTGAEFSTVDIRPDLLDMKRAKGAEPTPNGLLTVDARQTGNSTAINSKFERCRCTSFHPRDLKRCKDPGERKGGDLISRGERNS
jgi:hypothetical protein